MLQRQSSEAAADWKMKVMPHLSARLVPVRTLSQSSVPHRCPRQAGHQVVQKTSISKCGIGTFSEDFLKKVLRKVPQQLDRLRKLAKKRELEDWEQDLQLQLCEVSRQRIDELIKKAEQAKAIIRGEIFTKSISWSGRFKSS